MCLGASRYRLRGRNLYLGENVSYACHSKRIGKRRLPRSLESKSKIDAYAPFLSSTKLLDESVSTIAKIEVTQSDTAIYWRPYAEQSYREWEYLGHSPRSEFRLPNGLVELKLEKDGYETMNLVSANPSPRFNNMSFNPAPEIAPMELQPKKAQSPRMVYVSQGNISQWRWWRE